jgi:hypothetical protein
MAVSTFHSRRQHPRQYTIVSSASIRRVRSRNESSGRCCLSLDLTREATRLRPRDDLSIRPKCATLGLVSLAFRDNTIKLKTGASEREGRRMTRLRGDREFKSHRRTSSAPGSVPARRAGTSDAACPRPSCPKPRRSHRQQSSPQPLEGALGVSACCPGDARASRDSPSRAVTCDAGSRDNEAAEKIRACQSDLGSYRLGRRWSRLRRAGLRESCRGSFPRFRRETVPFPLARVPDL